MIRYSNLEWPKSRPEADDTSSWASVQIADIIKVFKRKYLEQLNGLAGLQEFWGPKVILEVVEYW